MSKKTFKDNINPALNFITPIEEKKHEEVMTVNKPDVLGNSIRSKMDYNYQNVKSKRMQILVTPKIYDDLQDIKNRTNQSLNAFINEAIEEKILKEMR